MFHLVIKNRGRIPASDSFVVKRIAGPGLASDYYYQVSVTPTDEHNVRRVKSKKNCV